MFRYATATDDADNEGESESNVPDLSRNKNFQASILEKVLELKSNCEKCHPNLMSWESRYYSERLIEILQDIKEKNQQQKNESRKAQQGCMKHIMVSYNHKSKDKADLLVLELQKLGLLVWIDSKGTEYVPGMMGETDAQMARAVDQSYCVICVISPEYCTSPNCIKEVCANLFPIKHIMVVWPFDPS